MHFKLHYFSYNLLPLTTQSQMNRVLRAHYGNSEFMIVLFRDEDGTILDNREVAFFDRIEFILNHGITVGGMHFKPLLWSNSQLKTCQMWFTSGNPT